MFQQELGSQHRLCGASDARPGDRGAADPGGVRKAALLHGEGAPLSTTKNLAVRVSIGKLWESTRKMEIQHDSTYKTGAYGFWSCRMSSMHVKNPDLSMTPV